MNVSNECPFISILSVKGLWLCYLHCSSSRRFAAQSEILPVGRAWFSLGIIMRRASLMELAVLLLPWLAKSALCTLAWQCWSVVYFPKSHTPKLWAVGAVNWSQVPGPWGGSFLSFVVSLVFTVQDWASSGSLLLIPLIHSDAKDCENNSK